MRTISRSPANVCVRVRLDESAVIGPPIPETAKLITRDAPYFGGVPEPPSGIEPTPVPANVTAVAGVQAAVGVNVAVAVAVAVFVGVFVGVQVGVNIGVAVFVGVFVGVSVGVNVAVAVAVAVGVNVFVAVGVSVAVFAGVGVSVGVSVAVFAGVGVSVAVLVAVAVFVAVNVDVAVAVGVKVGVFVGVAAAPVTVKFVLEISKNIFPTASTFIRAVVVVPTGMVTACDPSLAVLAARTVGKVWPPSVDMDIFTFAQLTAPALVLATFHVTVCDEPPAQETFVLG